MRAGRLQERIRIQQKQVTRDAYGAETVQWVDHADVAAEAAPIAGREFVALRTAQSEISIRFRVRFVAGVVPSMRVWWRAQEYDIIEVIDKGARRRELELLCKASADV